MEEKIGLIYFVNELIGTIVSWKTKPWVDIILSWMDSSALASFQTQEDATLAQCMLFIFMIAKNKFGQNVLNNISKIEL